MRFREKGNRVKSFRCDAIVHSRRILSLPLFFAQTQTCNNLSGKPHERSKHYGHVYQSYSVYRQGIHNVKDTIKRGEVAIAEAEKMGMKLIEEFWTMGAYDVVALFEAPNDETVSAFVLKNGALGNAKSQTLRAFRKEEMEGILAKIK